MVEYAALASRSIGGSFINAWQDVTNFIGDIPTYWYILAIVVVVVFFKAFAGKKI